MLAGIDTSFFYALAAGRPAAVEAWENRDLLTSALCFLELKKRLLRGDLDSWPTVLQDIAKAVEVAPVTAAAALKAAEVAHATGMPAFDALILAQFLEAGCEEVLTLDHHFKLFAKKGLKIVLL
ncbi:MAG TPA: type II toxin-antitoxin system VapC family toxin [Candidatus Aminicenantes bacterium]|nr:type II toxin-antitoxin system VapC family toxin [Candidatus Aminicenantes bacterium]